MMLHTKYQGSRPYGFSQEDFKVLFRKSISRMCDLDTRRTTHGRHRTITIAQVS